MWHLQLWLHFDVFLQRNLSFCREGKIKKASHPCAPWGRGEEPAKKGSACRFVFLFAGSESGRFQPCASE